MFIADFETAKIGKRAAVRSALGLDAELDGARRTLCRVSDISITGVRLMTYSALKVGSIIWLTLPLVGRVPVTVKWADEYNSGCQFSNPLSSEMLEALLVEAGQKLPTSRD